MNSPNDPNEKISEDERVKWEKSGRFAAGFLGWYLVNGLIWLLFSGGSLNGEGALILNFLIFPLNVIALLIFAFNRSTRFFALGLLGALAVNFVISLVIGLQFNAMCFIPFFIQ